MAIATRIMVAMTGLTALSFLLTSLLGMFTPKLKTADVI
jgi:hypothetical protein